MAFPVSPAPVKSNASNWRKGFNPDEKLQRIRPEATDAYLNNPHMGWATFQRFNGDPLQTDTSWHDDQGPVKFSKTLPRAMPVKGDLSTSVAYCRWPWAVLEPVKGEIRFDILDGALDTARRRGQTLQIRPQPFVHDDLPAWFLKSGVKMSERAVHQGRTVLEPDANDPRYIKHWSEHIRAIGKRYDGHPTLESVDMAYAGRFGEMGGNANAASAKKLIDAYLSAFKKTMLLSMVSTPGCRYAAGIKGRAIGWRGDGFMDPKHNGKGMVPDHLSWNHMWDVYPVDLYDYGILDTWKTAPVTMEPHATLAHVDEAGWDIDWLLDACLKYHPSIFMHKSVRIPEKWFDKVVAFAKRLGYRFHLHQMTLPFEARPGEKIPAHVIIDNKGIAPIYRPYKLALRFTQGKTHHITRFAEDIRKWMPDYSYFTERLTLPKTLRPGAAEVSCSIVNDDNEPVVRLGIKAVDPDGWHPLTWMDVAK